MIIKKIEKWAVLYLAFVALRKRLAHQNSRIKVLDDAHPLNL
jgi:hypothetical protein